MAYGVTRSNRQPLSSCEKLHFCSKLRRLELKYVRKALKALEAYSLVMPDRRQVSQWRKDKATKAALRDHLRTHAGVEQTVNPLSLRPALT